MDKKKTYYLVKGTTFKKKGLPGGELSAKKDHLKIEDKFIPVMEKNIDFLISQGKVVDTEGLEKLKGVKADKKLSKAELKAIAEKEATEKEALEALKLEAMDLEIEFSDDITSEDLTNLIADKKAV